MMLELEYKKIFSFNKSSEKYKIELTKAIKFLLSKKRVIEAKHHFFELEKINPNHKIVMDLGFETLFLDKRNFIAFVNSILYFSLDLLKEKIFSYSNSFFELEKINPNHKIVMDLGFELGIKTFDRAMSVKYLGLFFPIQKNDA
jgi:hypothetical protein